MPNSQDKRAAEHTSYEVRRRWDLANLKKYSVSLRKEDDADLIAFIEENKETIGTTELFRRALELLMDEGI